MGSCCRRWLISGKRPTYVSVSCCSMGLKEAKASCSVPWSLCMELGRDVSQEQLTENIHGMRKIYKLLYVIDTLSLPNPIMAVFSTYKLSLNFLFSCLICQTRKLKISERTVCLLHHNLSSLGATACGFIYLGKLYRWWERLSFIFEFPRESQLHLAEVVWVK